MWYPTVRRTLVCLSKLYRCLEREIFQGLSQQALSACMISVETAAQLISRQKTLVDGQLFHIKHLLILREQIAPFQVRKFCEMGGGSLHSTEVAFLLLTQLLQV